MKHLKKTGIMGGTFNPIHIGHLIIAEKAREQFGLDEVLFLPSGIPYMKNCDEVLPGKIRMEMTRLAIQRNPSFTISAMEVEREGRTYTFESLEDLRERNPDTEYYFILGADSLWQIETWKSPERIFAACHILAAMRDEKSQEDMERQSAYLKEKFGASIFLLQTGQIEISSSMIRSLCREGKSIRYLVPEAVYDYIMQKELYQCESSQVEKRAWL